MPSRNTARHDAAESYYHVYARGASKSPIFLEPGDKDYFLRLIARYLSDKPAVSSQGFSYPHYKGQVELLSYCLMDNHFHLFIYQVEQGALSAFMKSLMTSYSAYFNRKYQRSGSLFESRFKAAHIVNESHLAHISRYIHLNPRSWRYFKYSSINYIRNATEPEWLQTAKTLADFNSRQEYLRFLADYEDQKNMLETIKHDLADL